MFTGAGISRALLGQNETVVNALISPTGKGGYVDIATGPLSSQQTSTEVPVDTTIALLKDMGASSLKYFSMKGLTHKEEYIEVAHACARSDFYLEPTGGIDLTNFEEIVQIAIDAGVKKVIPHVYSSIIDKNTGNTNPDDVSKSYGLMNQALK